MNWGRKQSHIDWIEFQQDLVRRLQSADFCGPQWFPSGTQPTMLPTTKLILGSVYCYGLLVDHHAGELELAQGLAGAEYAD